MRHQRATPAIACHFQNADDFLDDILSVNTADFKQGFKYQHAAATIGATKLDTVEGILPCLAPLLAI